MYASASDGVKNTNTATHAKAINLKWVGRNLVLLEHLAMLKTIQMNQMDNYRKSKL